MSHVALPLEISQCIAACASCHQVCVDTVTYCLTMGGAHAAIDHSRVLLDCEQICATTQDFLLRLSTQHAGSCELCAQVCDDCATECEKFTGDAQMAACAQECRNCAASCRAAAGVRMPAPSAVHGRAPKVHGKGTSGTRP